jgi:tetratricopeptide (TPR) repeat protein
MSIQISIRNLLLFIGLAGILVASVFCNQTTENKAPQSLYLNHNDTVKYVGINTCKKCHVEIYESFIKTGMGKSFELASRKKSSAKMDKHTVIYDRFSDFYYHPFWDMDSLKIMEFRLSGKDTVYKRVEKVEYIIGSGQHTNSHLFSTNGYLRQMPMTYYTQKETWDLPPGFENGFNTRFNRVIGLECMTCHNSYPNFEEGAENKFTALPNGINCERCHGPGSMHVREKMAGNLVDTSKAIDYTIVNPGKLPVDLQFDVCQRCHLQGNAVLKNDKTFYDFKPGKKLSDYLTVFLPKYKGEEDKFIMASHADRLKMSQCFVKAAVAANNQQTLRPYKQSLTCVTCHNPHISVTQTGKEVYNTACKNCHASQKSKTECSEPIENRTKMANNNCVKCHMPKSSTIDIPHVTTTDHYIRKPLPEKEVQATKQFLGLYAINELKPPKEIICEAYINQFEKFDNNPMLLDSAEKYVDDKSNLSLNKNFDLYVRLQFCKKNYAGVLKYVDRIGKELLLKRQNSIFKKSLDNKNAWTLYRIGESYSNLNQTKDAELFYLRAVELADKNLEFMNKLGSALVSNGKVKEAKEIFSSIIKSDPKFASALSNYGYTCLLQNNIAEAEIYFDKALKMDPDLEIALLNKAGVLLYSKRLKEAKIILNQVIKKNPGNQKARELVNQL